MATEKQQFKNKWKLFLERPQMITLGNSVEDKIMKGYREVSAFIDDLYKAERAGGWDKNMDSQTGEQKSFYDTNKLKDIVSTWDALRKYLYKNENPNIEKVKVYRDGIINSMSNYAKKLISLRGHDKKVDEAANNLIKALPAAFKELNF